MAAISALVCLIERFFLSFFATLHTTLAATTNGVTAECVLPALVGRCDQYLPLYHPTTLTSLLDLAIAASMVREKKNIRGMSSIASARTIVYFPVRTNTILCSTFQCVGLLASLVILFFGLSKADNAFVSIF
jgi:hypothetical protein